MMRQILLYVFILFVGSISAEQFKITGKVVDAEYKDPFFGVLVEIKDADSCTSTDIDGNFSIEVEKGAILKFSFVGYISKEVEILNDSSLVVELEEDEKFPLRDDYMIGVGPTRREYNYKFTPIERDSTKTNPKNQNSVINH